MSTSIEQRVVQMRFDNKQFEDGVKQSMSTLDKLKAKLSFKGYEESFNNISRAAQQVSLETIGDQTDKVSVKFDAMTGIAITALQRMTNAAITAGTNMAKYLSVDQVTAGWTKYEQKTGSVQTIMNATGKSIDEVNGYLDKLMWFSDETSYGFTDMTAAIGQLTAAGGDIDKLVPMVMGIANATAYAGKGVNEFSRSIYNLNQSYSAGYLQYMDWKSLELAGVASKQLKEVFIETAEELGKVNKGAVTIANFGETLKNKWADTEVMEKAFGKFGEMTEKAYEMVQSGMVETASEAYELLSQTYDGYSIVAARAAQEAKSFAEAVEATKDAVSSGWMKTFEIIFGNYEEAKRLWTDLANTMWDIFASGADSRNEMLQLWKDLGGRTALIKTFAKAFENLSAVVDGLKSGFRDIFPPITAEQLFNATLMVKEFVYRLKLSDEAINTLRVTFKALLLPVQAVVQILRVSAVAAMALIKVLFDLGDALLALPSKIGTVNDPLKKLFGEERYNRIAQSLSTVVRGLGDAFSAVSDRIGDVISSGRKLLGTRIGDAFTKLVDVLSPIGGWILDRIVDGFEALSRFDFRKVGISFTEGFSFIGSVLKNLIGLVKNFFAQFDVSSPLQVLESIIKYISNLKTNFKTFIDGIGFGNILDAFRVKVSSITEVFRKFGEAVQKVTEKLTPAKILTFSFGTSLVWLIINVANAFKSFEKMAEAFTGVAGGFTGVLNEATNTLKVLQKRVKKNDILKIAAAIGILAVSLGLLSQIEPDRLKASTIALSSIMAVLGVLVAGMAAVNKFLVGSEEMAKSLLKVTTAMVMISGSVAAMAAALLLLSKIDMEGMWTKVGVLITVMVALGAASIAVAKLAPELTKGAGFLLLYALSISVVINSLEKLAKADLTGLKDNISGLIIVMGMLATLSAVGGRMNFNSAAGMTLMVMNVLLLVKVLQKVSEVDVGSIAQGIVIVGLLLTFMALVSRLGSVVGNKGDRVLQPSFLAMAASIAILGVVIKVIGELPLRAVVQGTVVVAAILGLFTAISVVSKVAEKGAKAASPAFLAMAGAILMLGLAISYIGGLETEHVIQGGVVVAAILTLFAVLTKVAGEAKGATGSIAAMAVALGLITASLMLLTLIPFSEVMQAAIALGTALLAFGAAMKLISSLDLKSAIGGILILLGITGSLILVCSALKDLGVDAVLPAAAGLALVIGALGAAMRLISGTEFKMGAVGLGAMAVMLVEVAAVLWALDQLTVGENMLEKAASLSMVLIAMTAATAVLSKFSPDVVSAAKGAAAFDAVSAIIIGFITALGFFFTQWDGAVGNAFDAGAEYMSKLLGLVPVIVAMGVVTAALGAMSGLAVAAIPSAASLDAVMAILVAFVTGVGALFTEIEPLEGYLDKGGEVLVRLAEIVGEFIGAIITGFVNKITSGLADSASNLGVFMENLQPFLAAVTSVSDDKLEAVKRLKELTDTLNGVYIYDTAGLLNMGDALVEFGPKFKEFANSIASVQTAPVYAASKLVESLAMMLQSIPTTGGLFGMIFGNKDFGTFSKGMKDFAEGFSEYAKTIIDSELSQDVVDRTKYATDALVNMANKIPTSGGALQDFFGTKDMGVFGNQLLTFARGLQGFFKVISGDGDESVAVDMSVVRNCANAGEALAKFASQIPSAGGTLQDFFGTKDMGNFGAQLVTFAKGLQGFFITMESTDISESACKMAIKIGEAFRDFASTLPTDNGTLQLFTGSQNIGVFGEDVKKYGEALVSFFTSFQQSTISDSDINLVKKAGLAFTEILKDIPQYDAMNKLFGNTDLTLLGNSMKNLGAALLTYSGRVIQVNFDAVESSIAAIWSIINMADSMSTIDTESATKFSEYLTNLATSSINDFIKTFNDSETRIAESITGTVANALLAASSDLDVYYGSSDVLVNALIAGIEAHKESLMMKAQSICLEFVQAVNDEWLVLEEAGSFFIKSMMFGIDSMDEELMLRFNRLMTDVIETVKASLGIRGELSAEFQDIGRYCIKGYINGLESDQQSVFTRLKQLGSDILSSFKASLGVASPSTEFAKVAMFSVLGFNKGIDDNLVLAKKKMVKMGETLLESIKDFFGIHSPSEVTRDEVGRYIVQGIAEGITQDMSAEEAASKKAQNIVNAFKSVFDSWDLNLQTADLEYELWGKLNPNASQNESNAKYAEYLGKQLSIQAERVNAANAQYQATLQALGENATETQEAYNTYLQEQITMADLAASMQEARIANTQAFGQFAELMKEAEDYKYRFGWNDEEFEAYAKRASGWVEPNKDLALGSTGLTDIMTSYYDQTSAAGEQVQVVLVESVSSGVSQAAQTAYQGGTAITQSLAQSINDNKQSVTDAAKNLFPGYKEGESEAIDYANGLEAGLDWLNQMMVDKGGEGTNLFTKIIHDGLGNGSPSVIARQEGEWFVEGLANGLTSMTSVNFATNASEGICNTVISTLKEQTPQFAPIGTQMMQGLANGISSGSSAVINAAIATAKQALLQTKLVLGIHSPSREFYRIGALIDKGLSNGILDEYEIVGKSIDKVKKDMTGGSWTVTPVIDSSDWDREWENMKKEFYGTVLQWDATGELVPVGYNNTGLNGGSWLKVDQETAKAVRLGNTILEKELMSIANEGKIRVDDEAWRESPTVNFTQNNYSPKSLSSAQIYKDTNTAVSRLATAVSNPGEFNHYLAPPGFHYTGTGLKT